MKITTTEEANETVLTLEGKLDANESLLATKAVLDAFEAKKNVILDFSGITYVSSAGLRTLLLAHKTAKSSRLSLKVRSISPEVMQVLEMTGFDSILTIV